jgi:hypothetical protein
MKSSRARMQRGKWKVEMANDGKRKCKPPRTPRTPRYEGESGNGKVRIRLGKDYPQITQMTQILPRHTERAKSEVRS